MWRTSLSTSLSRVAGHISAALLSITLILQLPCNVSRPCTPSHIQECSNDITFPKMCIVLSIPTNYMHKLTPYRFPSAQSCKKRKTTFTLMNMYIPDSKQRNYSRTVILDIFQHLEFFQTQHFLKHKASLFTLHITMERDATSEMLCLR